ncbi:MAG: tetratricopeptide repeat protein [Steroidobacteraceae bacterium]
MDEFLSENEQWELFKGWLKENGPWIVAGVAVGALAIGGWRWWQARTDRIDLAASALYDQAMAAFDADNRGQGLALLDELAHDYRGSPYVDQGNLGAARVFVESNELDQAAERLSSVAQKSRDPELATVARLRLARVEIAMHRPDAALDTLGAPQSGAFASLYHEIRGDAYYAKGDKAAALDEYRVALLAAGPSLAENSVLKLKIDDLRGETGSARTAAAASGK